jgi:cyclohexa-1,5-dienecarbonyl-CoA hydratase
MADTVRLHREGRVATLTIDRPPLNILDIPTIDHLGAQLAEAAADPGILVIVLRGAGERGFSAGVAVQDHTPDRVGPMLDSLHATIRRLRDLDLITIAAVHGHCLGGGMELAMACDLVIASGDARFAQPEIELGCFPPVATALLPQRIGAGLTLDLALTGRMLTATEAERLGLVTRCVSVGGLDEAVRDVAQDLQGRAAALGGRRGRGRRVPGEAAAGLEGSVGVTSSVPRQIPRSSRPPGPRALRAS